VGYVSNTDTDRAEMFAAIGIESFDELLAPIPEALRFEGALNLPNAMSEYGVVRHLQSLSAKNKPAEGALSFLGAGSYDHFRPTVVSAVMSRGEFMTAYTPYQPELSQGMLQTIYEFQTMICALTGMDISNASMYDASTSLAEAALMATNILNRNEIIVSASVHPNYREVVETYLRWTGYTLTTIEADSGTTDIAALKAAVSENTAAVLFQHPNFFGSLEQVQELVDIAHGAGALAVASVDPTSLGLLKPPGEYGVDIVVGEGQGLGSPMGYGGPLLGFFACQKKFLRAFPGRVVGATVDQQGRRGYTMTLRTREQDIRREKATSNICTNQALIALCATVYMAELGKTGISTVAELCLQKSHYCLKALTSIPGVTAAFPNARFVKEFVVNLPAGKSAAELVASLQAEGIIAGLPLARHYPALGDGALLVCVTETKTREDIDAFAAAIAKAVA
jgi:glycine dehydrogenase subunit 1